MPVKGDVVVLYFIHVCDGYFTISNLKLGNYILEIYLHGWFSMRPGCQ